MTRKSILRHEAKFVLKDEQSDSSLSGEDFNYLKEKVNKMDNLTTKISESYIKKTVDYLEEQASLAKNNSKPLYALRYLIEATLQCVKEGKRPIELCFSIASIIDDFNLESPNMLTLLSKFMEEALKANKEKMKCLTAIYIELLLALQLDDLLDFFCPKCEPTVEDSKSEKEGLEKLFIYWIEKNNYRKCLQNIYYVRAQENIPMNHSEGMIILRKIFYEELLNVIPSKQDRIILLKIAHECKNFNEDLTSKYEGKADKCFHISKCEAGKSSLDTFRDTENIAISLESIARREKQDLRNNGNRSSRASKFITSLGKRLSLSPR